MARRPDRDGGDVNVLPGTELPTLRGPDLTKLTMRHRPGQRRPAGMVAGSGGHDRNSAQYAPTQFGVPRSASPRRDVPTQFGSPTPTPSPDNPYGNPLLLPAYPGPVNTVPVNAGPAKQASTVPVGTRRVSMAPGSMRPRPYKVPDQYGATPYGAAGYGVSPYPIAPTNNSKAIGALACGVVGILGIWVCFVGLPVGIVAVIPRPDGQARDRGVGWNRPVRAWRPRVSCSAGLRTALTIASWCSRASSGVFG